MRADFEAILRRATSKDMNELSLDGFRHAIRQTYGSESQLVGRVGVDERVEGDRVWQGEVLIFALLDNPISTRCYAWETNRRVTTVLHAGPIDSPIKAVRTSILSDEGRRGGRDEVDD